MCLRGLNKRFLSDLDRPPAARSCSLTVVFGVQIDGAALLYEMTFDFVSYTQKLHCHEREFTYHRYGIFIYSVYNTKVKYAVCSELRRLWPGRE